MSVSTPSAPTAATLKNAKPKTLAKKGLLDALSGLPILGEIITWKCAGPYSFKAVQGALTGAGLDPETAKERLPRHAFGRALKFLAKEKIVEVLSEDKDDITFQFSGKEMVVGGESGKEVHYKTENFLRLGKETGVVVCKDENLRVKAQALLDQQIDERTTSDITAIVQKLFSGHADLIPVREQGGAYFVFAKDLEFVGKVEAFLKVLGGRVNHFPIPEGTAAGDASVQDILDDYLGKLVDEHEESVAGFDVHTKDSTLTAKAARINDTRVKVEAYAHFLKGKADSLLVRVEKAKELLTAKVTSLTEAKKTLPEGEKKGKDKIFAALTTTPQTMKELCAKAGISTTAYDYLGKLAEAGKVIKEGKTYRLPE